MTDTVFVLRHAPYAPSEEASAGDLAQDLLTSGTVFRSPKGAFDVAARSMSGYSDTLDGSVQIPGVMWEETTYRDPRLNGEFRLWRHVDKVDETVYEVREQPILG